MIGLLRSGALADHDLVWQDGMAEWKPAGDVIELQRALFATRTDGVSAGGIPVAAPSASQNGMAITSLVLGIISIMAGTLILTALPAVICGHIARRQIRESSMAQAGDGMAIAGLILGYISIILTVALGVMLVALFASIS